MFFSFVALVAGLAGLERRVMYTCIVIVIVMNILIIHVQTLLSCFFFLVLVGISLYDVNISLFFFSPKREAFHDCTTAKTSKNDLEREREKKWPSRTRFCFKCCSIAA